MLHPLMTLLQLGIGLCKVSDKRCEALLMLSMRQWQNLMTLAERQGVSAIAFDGVQRLYNEHPKNIKAAKESSVEWMQWVYECAGMMTQCEQMNLQQKKVIVELADICDYNGIKLMVFKGQANALFYPLPAHRAPGDVDCYMFGEADEGDRLLAQKGATVENNWYRHSKVSYHGETIENHRVLCHTRGDKKKKKMEEELKALLHPHDMCQIDGCGKALMPTAQFNAYFLSYHALHHFTSEGLRMKQILDWAMFLKSQQNNVDWDAFYDFCERYKVDKFAAVMNFIAVNYLGVPIEQNIIMDGTYAEKVLHSTLYDDDYLFNSGKSDWIVRWLLVKNMLIHDRWKYEDIAQENAWKHLWLYATGFLFDKD